MAACVQSITYDLTAGKTTFTFGPAAHLGAKDLVERLRTNRYPIRPYYGNGGNMTNAANSQGGAQLGNSAAQRGPSPGAARQNLLPMPISATDYVTFQTDYLTGGSGVGAPGVTIDTRGSGQPNYGAEAGSDIESARLSAPTLPTIHLQAGSGRTVGACIRISVSDLVGTHKQAWFQPATIQVCSGATLTVKTIYIHCTAPE
jgi:hypothetical protein